MSTVAAIAVLIVGALAYVLFKRIIAIGGKAQRTVIEHKRAVFGNDWPRYRITHNRERKQHRDVLRWRRKAS